MLQVMYFAKHGFFSPSLNCKIIITIIFKNSRCGHFVIRLLANDNYLLPVKTWSQIFATFAMLILFQFCNLFWIGRIGHFFLVGCLPHQRLVTDICPFAFLWCRLCQKFANITMGNCPKARVAKGLKVHVSSIAYLYLALCFYVPKTSFVVS